MQYVALLRGIGPGNPNMRNDKLRGVFERLGFTNVKTVISSGNITFDSPSTDTRALEATIEKALPQQLGFVSTTIIRSREQLLRLVNKNPFENRQHNQQTYLTVTFLKNPAPAEENPPEGRGFKILGLYDNAVCSVADVTEAKTPDLMSKLERHYGKEITTRTWKTVERIFKAFG